MRLLWASLLVLLPLVAEFAYAQGKCAGEPEAPEHATVRCFKKRGTCRAMCPAGYIFEGKNAKSAIYTCVGGQWEMKDGHEDRCSPVCDPPCENGECIEPDTCDCEAGFTGDLCEEEEYDEDYATEEPIADSYDDNDYGDEDAYGDEDHTEDYEDEEEEEEYEADPAYEDEDEDEEVDVVEADVHEAEPEPEDEPEIVDDAEDEDEDEAEAEPTAEADPEEEDEDNEETVDEDENGDGNTDDTNGDDDAEDDDDDPHVGASTSENGVSEVVPQILVGTAALLMVKAW